MDGAFYYLRYPLTEALGAQGTEPDRVGPDRVDHQVGDAAAAAGLVHVNPATRPDAALSRRGPAAATAAAPAREAALSTA